MSQIMAGEWSEGSGKIKNPGKLYFLKLASKAIRAVNAQRDENGLTYSRKAMISMGMALNTNVIWEESQLFPVLQAIIQKHRNHFNGKPVVETST